jgi:AraC-like DNA-binding protein
MTNPQSVGELPCLILPWGKNSGESAFQEWSETVATIFDLDATPDSIDDFRFGFSAYHLGSLVLGVSHSDPIKFRRAKQTIARSGIDHYLVQVYQTGGLFAETEGQEMKVAPGDVWILDLSREADIKETTFRSTNLAIPRSLLAPLLGNADGLHGLKLSADSALGGMLSRYLVDLAQQAPRMEAAEAISMAEATIHLVAGCIGANDGAQDLVRSGFAKATVAEIRKFIEEQLANPALDVELICKQFGLSRASLYRLCEPLGGVHAHIRRRRLARCFQELVTPGPNPARISQIGFRWGFSDEASLSRAFRAMYGLSPSEARAEGYVHYARIAFGESGNPAGESELSKWIRDLMKR